MRVWHISPTFLDDKRLYAAHNEIHICHSVIVSGKRWGQSVLFNNSLSYVVTTHFLIVLEICQRKDIEFVDTTPMLSYPRFNSGPPFVATEEVKKRDARHLRQKWECEGYYFGVGREDLRRLEISYGLQVGISFAEAKERQKQTKALYKKHKVWFDAFRTVFPNTRFQDRWGVFQFGLINDVFGVRVSGDTDQREFIERKYERSIDELLIQNFKAIGKAGLHSIHDDLSWK